MMLRFVKLCLSVVAVLAFSVQQARAVVLAYENFGSGPLEHANNTNLTGNGFGWAGNWIAASGVSGRYYNKPAAYAAATNIYSRSGDSYGFLVAGSASRASRQLDLTVFDDAGYVDFGGKLGEDNTTLYIGFAMAAEMADPIPTDPPYFGFELHRGGSNDVNRTLHISENGASADGILALRANDSVADDLVAIDNNINYYVLRLDFGAGNADTATVYYNPVLYQPESLQAGLGTPIATVTGTDLSFDRVSFGRFGNNNVVTLSFDDLRIATTWADVVGVPEPGSLSLMLMAATAFGVLRRRRAVRPIVG